MTFRDYIYHKIMKKRNPNEEIKINGLYSKELMQGFFGEQNEGRQMLMNMGLPYNEMPFSAVVFLRNQCIFWKDNNGNVAHISFKLKEQQIECFGTYNGKRKSIRLFREWNNYEDEDTIARLESEAIGDCCAKCIYEIM